VPRRSRRNGGNQAHVCRKLPLVKTVEIADQQVTVEQLTMPRRSPSPTVHQSPSKPTATVIQEVIAFEGPRTREEQAEIDQVRDDLEVSDTDSEAGRADAYLIWNSFTLLCHTNAYLIDISADNEDQRDVETG